MGQSVNFNLSIKFETLVCLSVSSESRMNMLLSVLTETMNIWVYVCVNMNPWDLYEDWEKPKMHSKVKIFEFCVTNINSPIREV